MSPKRAKKRRANAKRSFHLWLILFLVAAGVFFLYKEFSKEDIRPKKPPKYVKPEERKKALPKIAVVIDDLGFSKDAARKVLDINTSITLSIIPQETYTEWIAREGRRRGHDIIGHIPMEAKSPHKLGKGGLYTWMTDDEVQETLKADIDSIPHIIGVSSHMGSAFTEDERAVSVLMGVLKEKGLFFIDSLTTPHSVAARSAEKHRVKMLKRDIFLDDKDTPDYIKARWQEAVKIAQKQGHAIILAHPRENTIRFLKEVLPKNEVKIVPLSELL